MFGLGAAGGSGGSGTHNATVVGWCSSGGAVVANTVISHSVRLQSQCNGG